MDGILTTIEHDGAPALAIRVGGGASRPSGQALSSLLGARGCMVRHGRVEAWRAEGAAETETGVFLYGPAFEGRGLDDASEPPNDPAGGVDAAFDSLLAAASGLVLAAGQDMLPRGLVAEGVLLGEGGDILILPPEPILRAMKAAENDTRKHAPGFPRSPRAETSDAEAAFLLAQLIYRAASGESAYAPGGTAAGEAGRELASGGFVPLALRSPRLDAELAELVDATLAEPGPESLGRLRDALAAARGRGWLRSLTAAEEEAASRRLAAARAALDARRRRETFVRKRGGILIGAAVAVVLLLVGALTVADARRGKPDYSALSPRELVETYYRAIDSLDLDSLSACATSGAARADMELLSTMTVISKTRLAYEGKNPIVSARAWTEAGKPPLGSDSTLYGITNLSIVELSAVDNAATYRAEYSSWSTEHIDNGSLKARERAVSDNLTLEKSRSGAWRIIAIERNAQDR